MKTSKPVHIKNKKKNLTKNKEDSKAKGNASLYYGNKRKLRLCVQELGGWIQIIHELFKKSDT